MKIKLDDDLLLPIATVIISLIFVLSTFFISVPTHEQIIEELINENAISFQEVSSANHEISTLTHQLEEYHTTEESLISLGASHTQAVAVIKAAEVYNLDPKY